MDGRDRCAQSTRPTESSASKARHLFVTPVCASWIRSRRCTEREHRRPVDDRDSGMCVAQPACVAHRGGVVRSGGVDRSPGVSNKTLPSPNRLGCGPRRGPLTGSTAPARASARNGSTSFDTHQLCVSCRRCESAVDVSRDSVEHTVAVSGDPTHGSTRTAARGDACAATSAAVVRRSERCGASVRRQHRRRRMHLSHAGQLAGGHEDVAARQMSVAPARAASWCSHRVVGKRDRTPFGATA